MKQRCQNPNHHKYKDYGGRGITVCEEWETFENFLCWATKNGYDANASYGACTLDRIDVDGNNDSIDASSETFRRCKEHAIKYFQPTLP